MGRPDAAGGENVIIAGAQRVERGDDLLFDVGHNARLAQIDADVGEILGDVTEVAVLGAARQDFIADHQNCGGDNLLAHKGASSASS